VSFSLHVASHPGIILFCAAIFVSIVLSEGVEHLEQTLEEGADATVSAMTAPHTRRAARRPPPAARRPRRASRPGRSLYPSRSTTSCAAGCA